MKKIFPVLLLIILSVVILESGSRALLLIKPFKETLSKSNCDAAWRWRWIERHKLGMQILYSFDKYDLIKGWGVKPNLSNEPCFENKVLNTNSRGIRGSVEHAYAKDKRKLRILFLGDSFTFGEEDSDQETYPDYLQQLLPETEVINLGVHGYGHDQMLLYLKEEGVKYKPDIIILGFISEDRDRNMLTFRDYAKPRIKYSKNRLDIYNIPVPPPEMTLKLEPWRSNFLDMLSVLKYRLAVKSGFYEDEREELAHAILKEIVFTARDINAIPIFLYLENIRSLEPNQGMTREEQNFYNEFKNIPVSCVFLRSGVYYLRRQGLKINDWGHFDPNTNRVIALGIKEYLVTSGLLKKK